MTLVLRAHVRAFLFLALVGCAGEATAEHAEAPPPPPDVSIVTVAPHAVVVEDLLPGRVVPVRAAEVRPLVSGIVRQRLFDEGDTVTAGQALYRIDTTVFRAEVTSATATRERQRAAVTTAAREAERAHRLAQGGAIPGQTVDTADSTLAIAEADLAVSEATLQRTQISLRYTTVTAPIAGPSRWDRSGRRAHLR